MKKVLTLMGMALTAFVPVAAQSGADPLSMQAIEWPLDSLFFQFHCVLPHDSTFSVDKLNKYHFPPDVVPTYTPAETEQRLKDLGSAIPFAYNPEVQAFIDLYTLRRRDQVSRMLGLQHVYFPMIEQELDRLGMPDELKYLPIVESALNPHAVSRAGATGLWQFMLATGKLYNLKVTSFVDERRDPMKATQAALRYLKNMYGIYKDWLLVIASYNCGPGNVNRAIARSGGKMTFWEISDYLPRETRGYVPAFIAANYVFRYSSEHNIYPCKTDFSFTQDTIMITRQQISLDQIAAITGADFYTLCDLNPELKTKTIPYSGEGYPLRVMHETAMLFTLYRDSVFKKMAELKMDSVKIDYAPVSNITRNNYQAYSNGTQATPAATNTQTAQQGTATGSGVLVYHTVRYGDIVSKIGERYYVTAGQISSWNGLSNYRIWPGQKLKIYISEKRATELGITTTPQATQQAAVQQPTNNQNNGASATTPNGTKVYYRVQPGDTLWDIAQKYDGLTVEKIKSMNSLGTNSLQVGQVLVVAN
jgi:membrane-bound lytic murein transglycosylase D